MSLILSGIKSNIAGITNKTVTSYTKTSTAISGAEVFVVAANSDGSLVFALSSSTGSIYTSANNSAYILRQTFTESSISLCCSSDGTKVYVPVNNNFIQYSTDSGVTFSPSNASNTWRDICCSSDGTKVYAAYLGDSIYKSINSGVTYSQVTISGTSIRSVACSSDGIKVYVSTDLGVYFSSDTGSTFSLLSTISSGIALLGMACSGDASVVSVVDSISDMYISVDSGATFYYRLSAVASPDISVNGRVIVTFSSNAIRVSNDYGVTWIDTGLPTNNYINCKVIETELVLFYGDGDGSVNKAILNMSPVNNLGTISTTVESASRANLSTVFVPSTTISTTSATTTTNAFSLSVQGPLVAGTNHTIADSYALEVANGTSIFNGPVFFNSLSGSTITAARGGSINFSGCSGTFLTSTGNVTLGGNTSTVVLGSGTTPTTSLSFAAGSTGTFNLSNSTSLFRFPSSSAYRGVRILTTTTTLSESTGGHFIVVTSGTFTITLPGIQTAATNGLEYFVTNSGSGTITLSVANVGTERFNGGTSTTITISQHDRTHIVSFTNVTNSLFSWYNF